MNDADLRRKFKIDDYVRKLEGMNRRLASPD
jgi:hypothetical protein